MASKPSEAAIEAALRQAHRWGDVNIHDEPISRQRMYITQILRAAYRVDETVSQPRRDA